MASTRSATANETHLDRLPIRDRIPIQSDYAKGVAWQREDHVFGCARIQQTEEHTLTLLDADWFAEAEHVLIHGGVGIANIRAGSLRQIL